jgi:hypothetical protein
VPLASETNVAVAKKCEAATLETLFAAAHRRQQDFQMKSPRPPRFLLESALAMARHVGMCDRQMQECIPQMAFWQLFLPSALAGDTANFTEARFRLPWTFERVHQALAAMESRPQVVVAAFHMAGLPVVLALLAAAWADLHPGARHALLARQNMGWLSLENSRWASEAADILTTDTAGLCRLISGLRSGTIKRLLILVDGPHPPGDRDTRALSNVSPTLGFKTSLLTKILSMGIPVRPLTHFWESNQLQLAWHPLLDPTGEGKGIDAAERGISTVASLIEDLLRRHPEQWLNWAAASLRT